MVKRFAVFVSLFLLALVSSFILTTGFAMAVIVVAPLQGMYNVFRFFQK